MRSDFVRKELLRSQNPTPKTRKRVFDVDNNWQCKQHREFIIKVIRQVSHTHLEN